MRANGMSQQSFGVGTAITLKGYGARDGSKSLGFLRQITFDDGGGPSARRRRSEQGQRVRRA